MPVTPHTLEVDGTDRHLLIAAPDDLPAAIVLSMHGSTTTPERQVGLSRMAALAEQGALVAFPQGSVRSRAGWAWDLQADVGFLDAVIDHLRERFGAESAPLCVTGMSGGARMASRYSAVGRHPVRVLGAVAGLREPPVDRRERPVRVVAFHGTRDRINPYGGGSTARWRESVLEAATGWAHANGLSATPEAIRTTPRLTRLSWGASADPGAVTLWVCDGAGHTWPGTALGFWLRLFLGKVSHDIDATAEIWQTLAVT